jgi:NADP-dependent aldehyde dehydrogenase
MGIQAMNGGAEASAADVDQALNAAGQSMRQTAEREASWPADLLEQIASNLNDDAAAILQTAAAETNLPAPRLEGELGRTVRQLRMFADQVRSGEHLEPVIDLADPTQKPVPRPDLRRMNVPIGPVAVFTASNFPLAFGVAGGDTASALAAGNAVVVKGHPAHPATCDRVARAIARSLQASGLPAGLFTLLQGRSPQLGESLVQHPGVAAVGFTGSRRVGRRLHDLAAARPQPIPFFAEMASVNPVLVLPGAMRNIGTLAQELAASVALGSGQFCTKPGIIFCPGDGTNLAQAMARHLAPKGAMQMLGPRFRDDFLAAAAECAQLPNIQLALQPQVGGDSAASALVLIVDVRQLLAQPRLHDEIFGPGVIVVTCPDVDAALDAIEQLGGHLTTTVRAGSQEEAHTLQQVVRRMARTCGRVVFNGVPTGVEVCPAMVHGGPYPATTAAASTSVGTLATRRFLRPVAFQNVPDALLPPALQNANPLGLSRRVNGRWTTQSLDQQP